MFESVPVVAAGVGAGVLAALALGRFLGALLFEVAPADPVSFVAAGALAVTVAVLASYVTARSAARVDPLVALRND
jgi:putative ABC transport system permease protein